ncbi:hypothetical protein CBS101457_003397 [Exobasidium rhododendri]|nr:hypothetical protein CBS101457_003397 [Exobasidium rhododendri]
MSASASAKTSKRDDVEALLSDLDNLDHTGQSSSAKNVISPARLASKTDDAQSLLNDLDDLVKRRGPTPTKSSMMGNTSGGTSMKLTKTARRTNLPASSNGTIADQKISRQSMGDTSKSDAFEETEVTLQEPTLSGTSTGHVPSAEAPSQPSWGNWWNSATKLADQARAELEKRAAQVQSQVAETAREANEAGGLTGTSGAGVPWAIAQNVNSFLKNNRDLNKLKSDFSKVGMKGWNDLMNVVVPPIEKHEILSITLSHDMVGFDGIDDVVFAVLQKVMETQASSHNSEQQLVVNKAPEVTSPKEARQGEEEEPIRSMQAVTGFEQGWNLAKTKLAVLVDEHRASHSVSNVTPESSHSVSLPITTCPLFIRIQPVLDVIPGQPATSTPPTPTHLFLEIVLQDPSNSLTHKTISQPILKDFIDLDFEDHSWVEDLLSESLQAALSSIGLEYIQGRTLGTSLRSDVVEASTSELQVDNDSRPQ